MKKFTKVVDVFTCTFDNDSLRRRALSGIGVAVTDSFDIQVEFGYFVGVVVGCREKFQELVFNVLTIVKTRMHLKEPANVSSIEC